MTEAETGEARYDLSVGNNGYKIDECLLLKPSLPRPSDSISVDHLSFLDYEKQNNSNTIKKKQCSTTTTSPTGHGKNTLPTPHQHLTNRLPTCCQHVTDRSPTSHQHVTNISPVSRRQATNISAKCPQQFIQNPTHTPSTSLNTLPSFHQHAIN